MSPSPSLEAPVSVIAKYLGRTLSQMYYLARQPGAPKPVSVSAGIASYSLDEWLAFAPPLVHGQDISFDG